MTSRSLLVACSARQLVRDSSAPPGLACRNLQCLHATVCFGCLLGGTVRGEWAQTGCACCATTLAPLFTWSMPCLSTVEGSFRLACAVLMSGCRLDSMSGAALGFCLMSRKRQTAWG